MAKKCNLVVMEDVEKIFEPKLITNDKESEGDAKDANESTQPDVTVEEGNGTEETSAPKDSESLETSVSEQDSGLAPNDEDEEEHDDEEEEGSEQTKIKECFDDMDIFTSSEEDDEVFLEKDGVTEKNIVNDCEIISSDEEWQ